MSGERNSAKTRAVLAAGGLGFAALLVCGFVWWTRPPQMGAEEEVFTAVDALFTAVTARDEKLLGQCEQRLNALKDAGKLPGDASDYLVGIIGKARAGRWESAAETLYGFMKAQRREGAEEHRTKKKDKGRPNGGKK
jgi:hypothetical protein